MQQAHGLTGECAYIEEAERAAGALTGLGFDLGYQYNNTAFGAGALMWLWKQTGKELYRDLSHVCMASILQNLWLWECRAGCGKHYQTFMGLPPLRSAPYLAVYEELEMLAAFHEYFAVAGDDALPALRVLVPEYCKYLIDRAWHHYPSEFPGELLAEKPKTGFLDRNLSIPVEDMYASWEKVGQVGQQVYGAAAPFVFATRHDHRIPGEEFVVHCDVPVRNFELRPGKVSFRAEGDRRCTCHVRIVAQNFTPLPEVRVTRLDTKKQVKGVLTRFGYLEFELPGNAAVRVNWRHRLHRLNKRRTEWKQTMAKR